MKALSIEEFKRADKAAQFVGLLDVPKLHQVTIDFCEEVEGLPVQADDRTALYSLIYNMRNVLDVCRPELLDFDVLTTLLRILDPPLEEQSHEGPAG